MRLWVAAFNAVFNAFRLCCLCKGAMFSMEQAFVNSSDQEEASSKGVRGEPLALGNGAC